MTKLWVVTLYPYEDGSEARYQFDHFDQAQAFADRVNALPPKSLSYITGSGRPIPVEPWESGTYDTTGEAWAALIDASGTETCNHPEVDLFLDDEDPAAEVQDRGTCRSCGAEVHLEPTEDGDRYWELD